MQCVPCILHLFYFLSTRWTDLLQSCLPFLISSHDTLRRHLAVIVDKTLLKALAELMWYLWKYNSLKHKQHLVLVVGSEWEAMLLPYHWQMVMLYCGNHFETPPWKGEVNILWITECLFKFYVFFISYTNLNHNFCSPFLSLFYYVWRVHILKSYETLSILFALTGSWFKRNENRF